MDPIFDETIEAPTRFRVKRNGNAKEMTNLHLLPTENTTSNRTIGAIRNHVSPEYKPLAGLFETAASTLPVEKREQTTTTTTDDSMDDDDDEEETDSMRVEITAPVLI